MTTSLLSVDSLDLIGPAARGAVICAFLVFIGLCLLWVLALATQTDDPEHLYVAGRSLPPVFNGVAMAGEQITVVILVSLPGAIALFGYDGVSSAVDSALALGVFLLLAARIRETRRYTLGELFSLRAEGPGVRVAGAVVTLCIAVPLLMVQLRAGGITAALLIGMPTETAQVVCTVLMGCLVTCFAGVADLRGNSFVQAVKVPVALATLTAVILLALRRFDWSPASLLSAAVDNSTSPGEYLSPGLWAHSAGLGPLGTLSDHIVVVLGTAMMPHLLLRVSAGRDVPAARRSLSVAVGLTGLFYVLLIATGFAATAVVGGGRIGAVDAKGQGAPILLASEVLPHHSTSRIVLITLVACVAFLAVLTAVASVTFAAAVSVTRDLIGRRSRIRTGIGEPMVMRLSVVALCAVSLVLTTAVHRYPIEFLLAFSLSLAASCVFPALVYSFLWAGFDRRGLLWLVYGGLSLCVLLTLFSPAVSGTAYALLPDRDFDLFPLHTPGLVSVPAAFLLGWLGSARPWERTTRSRHTASGPAPDRGAPGHAPAPTRTS
ncbi:MULTISPECIES: sodium:solute symporter family transporter [Streptomyces]|uniref:sodium:solute symporter family transporter n=1 Tax=Streptomyces TaxID=1883 RepID=UPI000788B345|nr:MULTISPECIES: transporter [unclassified Streptomyces]AVH94293.1 transporter [Streptomyces sp. WAC00288]KYG51283.1 transporter [Streptomyces sp. WAC04657]